MAEWTFAGLGHNNVSPLAASYVDRATTAVVGKVADMAASIKEDNTYMYLYL